ncbi:hypothetical protein AB0J83_16650 [Actinoplanes sp. NPDC049596]|uniref:hypothetical protein n=1 Tax=unclassified Actinoplanes TaxID=2626549 RepID=UPI00341D949B
MAPGLAGLLLTVMTPASVLAVDAVSFLASALLLRAITRAMSGVRNPAARKSLYAEAREGLIFLRNHPTIRPMTIMSFAQSGSGGAALGLRGGRGLRPDRGGPGLVLAVRRAQPQPA